jgi:hypothetical protein
LDLSFPAASTISRLVAGKIFQLVGWNEFSKKSKMIVYLPSSLVQNWKLWQSSLVEVALLFHSQKVAHIKRLSTVLRT